MTGGEIVAAGKAAKAVGEKILGEDDKTKAALVRAAEGTPEMDAAGRALARRTAVIEQMKLRIIQPFARMFGVSGAYFRDEFAEDLAAKMASIPDENVVPPPANVAVPALQGLSYSVEEPNLKELYLNLLTTASDDRRSGEAHPAFVEIIKQLSPAETGMLTAILPTSVPAVRIKIVTGPNSWVVQDRHVMNTIQADGQPAVIPFIAAWVDNWCRLGLVEVTYAEYHSDEGKYDYVPQRPEYIKATAVAEVFKKDSEYPDVKVDYDKGLVRPTSLGDQFRKAVS